MHMENVTQYTVFSKSGKDGHSDLSCTWAGSCCSEKNIGTEDKSGLGLKCNTIIWER